jgi:DNA-directed RNA polymerase specialized sigma24 family protein
MEAIEDQQPTFEPALEKILVRTVDYWAYKLDRAQKCSINHAFHGTGFESAPRNDLFPLKEDVIAQTWIKILAPRVKATIIKIWADPDPSRGGFKGVTKFVSVLETRTAQDLYRKNRIRWGEIIGTSLQEVFQTTHDDGGSESSSATMGNIFLSDERGFQAFSLDDLKSIMSDSEFELFKASLDGAAYRELATEFGVSKSTVGRTVQAAFAKAQAWIEELKHANPEKTSAHKTPCPSPAVFGTRASLRPNNISRENLAAFAPNFNVVPFHDESSEWRPKITGTHFTRAKWHCVNDACQNGIAVGPDNLALPKDLRHEAVRFLPSINARPDAALGWVGGGKGDKLCPTCKKQAEKVNALELPDAKMASVYFCGEKLAGNINSEEYAYA